MVRVLPFVARTPPKPEVVLEHGRRRATHCEACGAPTTRLASPPANGLVRFVCLTCERQWSMADRRQSPRPPEP
jgi:hypothetical protein